MNPETPPNYDPEATPEAHKAVLDISQQIDPFSQQSIELADELSTWEGYIKNKDGEIEYTRPLRSVRSTQRKQKLEDFISQADPVKITPSRAKPVQRPYRLLMAFGDSQIDFRSIGGELVPTHDDRALKVIEMFNKHYMPDVVVDLGDTVDLAALSRFQADSDHFNHSMNPAFNRAHTLYAQLRADNPAGEIKVVASNHEKRLSAFVLRNAAHLYGLKQPGATDPYPVLSYPFLANLSAVGVDWFGGYGAAKYIYGEEYGKPPIVFKHGETMVSAGSTANKESKDNPDVHVVRGHGHRNEVHTRTNRLGDYLSSIMVGCTCKLTGEVASYHSAVDDFGKVVPTQENWQQSLLLIEDYEGDYVFHNVPIKDGVARFQGKVFDSNET